jgi:hypothetical protein
MAFLHHLNFLGALWGFDLDTSGLITQAEDIFNGLQGAYVPIIGISLGVSLLSFIVAEIRRAF